MPWANDIQSRQDNFFETINAWQAQKAETDAQRRVLEAIVKGGTAQEVQSNIAQAAMPQQGPTGFIGRLLNAFNPRGSYSGVTPTGSAVMAESDAEQPGPRTATNKPPSDTGLRQAGR